MGATSKWTTFEAGFPVNGTAREKLGYAVKCATLASADLHWQPCDFRISDYFTDLYAREGSTVDELDPERRERMIRCGASLQYLKLALKRHGCLGRVELFPELDRPTLAARIHVGHGGGRDPQEAQLFEAIQSGEADTASPGVVPVPDTMLDVLRHSVARERSWLELAKSESSQQRLVGPIGGTDHRPLIKLHLQEEPKPKPVDSGRDTAGFVGTRLHERFSRWKKPFLQMKERELPPPPRDLTEETETVPSAGTYAVLKTKTDDRHGWLAAGQTMARLILQARTLGLSCLCLTRVLQMRRLRYELRTAIGHKGYAQAILCFGAQATQTAIRSSVQYSTTATGNSI